MNEGGPNTPSHENDAILGKALREAFESLPKGDRPHDVLALVTINRAQRRIVLDINESGAYVIAACLRMAVERQDGQIAESDETARLTWAAMEEEGTMHYPFTIHEAIRGAIQSL